VLVGQQVLHCLCSHPTPPSFDDGQTSTHGVKTSSPAAKADWNGLRNHDEIRFFADYVDPTRSAYIYDDQERQAAGNQKPTSPRGGLAAGARFVLLGDQNADPVDGNSSFSPIQQVLEHPLFLRIPAPTSPGAEEQVDRRRQERAAKTARFNLRADYVLPSKAGMQFHQGAVFWPTREDALSHLIDASDHHLVWTDLSLTPVP
jgi:hypothetical protein